MPRNSLSVALYTNTQVHLKKPREFLNLESLYTLSGWFKRKSKRCVVNSFTVVFCLTIGVSTNKYYWELGISIISSIIIITTIFDVKLHSCKCSSLKKTPGKTSRQILRFTKPNIRQCCTQSFFQYTNTYIYCVLEWN